MHPVAAVTTTAPRIRVSSRQAERKRVDMRVSRRGAVSGRPIDDATAAIPFSFGRWGLGTLLLAGALGCTTGPESAIDDLRESRNRWLDQGIVSYRVTIQRLCFCGDIRPVRVQVTNGVVTSRVFVDDGQPVPTNRAESYPAISGLFDFLEAAFRRADEATARYDATLGIPLEANIDFAKNAADDELVIRVTDFVPDPP